MHTHARGISRKMQRERLRACRGAAGRSSGAERVRLAGNNSRASGPPRAFTRSFRRPKVDKDAPLRPDHPCKPRAIALRRRCIAARRSYSRKHRRRWTVNVSTTGATRGEATDDDRRHIHMGASEPIRAEQNWEQPKVGMGQVGLAKAEHE